MEKVYKIKKALRIPLIFISIFLFLLFIISLFKGQAAETIILAAFFVFSIAVNVEAMEREIIIKTDNFTIRKFFRRRDFSWAEITHLALVVLKKKVYFLLTTTRGFYIFSNLFENHAELVRSLADKLGEEKVEVEIKKYLEMPVERFSTVIMCWVAVAIMALAAILKLAGI